MALALASAVAASPLALGAVEADAAAPAHGRAWELVTVTPPDPGGQPPSSMLAVGPTGDRVVYQTLGPTPGASAGSIVTANVAVRGSAGWRSVPLTYPYTSPETNLQLPYPVGASKDLATFIWTSARPLLPGAPSYPDRGLYRAPLNGPLTLLGNAGDASFFTITGASDDAQRVVFETSSQLLPADAARTGGTQVYEYVGTTLRLVGVDTGGALLSTCGARPGSPSLPPNPVSHDGERIFMTACGESGVYLRQNEATTEISASRCTRADCNAPAAIRFMGATPDGSTAFLATSQQLTNDDVDESSDLYRYDVADATLSRVSATSPGLAADVVATIAHPSHDGRRVYFLGLGILEPGKGSAGSPNLYLADGDGVRFVATLSPSDEWPSTFERWSLPDHVEVTPDGGRLMLVTAAALTADDTDGRQDVYLYDAEDDALTRVSGLPGRGNGDFRVDVAPRLVSTGRFATNPPRALSDDGRHVFLVTSESLLPEDVDAAADVYEWFDGSLGLVSSGPGVDDALFFGASADGSTALVSTNESLLPGDDDRGDYDLYAARRGGGFPEPQAPASECEGSACFPPPPARLSRSEPGSVSHVRRSPARLRVRRPGASALRRMSARGRLTLVAIAPKPGRVAALARARIGRRVRTIARGRVTVARAGRTSLRLRLSRPARRRLAVSGALDVRVVLAHSRLDRVSVIRFRLEVAK